jgi:hypothetical protein
MVQTCERCYILRAEMDSACIEAKAMLQDSAARVTSPANHIALFKEAKKRWDDAVAEFEAHRASHFPARRFKVTVGLAVAS